MWKARPDENRLPLNTVQPAIQPAVTASPTPATVNKEVSKPTHDSFRGDVGHIGKSVVIRGELSGSEDLYLDGEVEGTINLRDHKLIVGPNGKIKAAITARDVVVHGRVEGNIGGSERVELKRAATLAGDISTQRIVIEDGAVFKGSVDIKEQQHRETRTEHRKTANSGSLANGGANLTPAFSAAVQGSFLESK